MKHTSWADPCGNWAPAPVEGRSTADAFLEEVLRCPGCDAGLEVGPRSACCISCGASYHRSTQGAIDLLGGVPVVAGDDWQMRQKQMEDWYRDLLSDPAAAAACFEIDYLPLSPMLSGMHGSVLDLGGGAGITRHYLPEAERYLVVEPSSIWLELPWKQLEAEMPCMAAPPRFVYGVGERLPIRDAAFDAVLSLWSLNHSRDPGAVLSEAHRVLRPGGLLLLVLEDMVPRWSDVVLPTRGTRGEHRWPHVLLKRVKLAASGASWPLQEDHLRIDELRLRQWCEKRFQIRQRRWVGQYLTLLLEAHLR